MGDQQARDVLEEVLLPGTSGDSVPGRSKVGAEVSGWKWMEVTSSAAEEFGGGVRNKVNFFNQILEKFKFKCLKFRGPVSTVCLNCRGGLWCYNLTLQCRVGRVNIATHHFCWFFVFIEHCVHSLIFLLEKPSLLSGDDSFIFWQIRRTGSHKTLLCKLQEGLHPQVVTWRLCCLGQSQYPPQHHRCSIRERVRQVLGQPRKARNWNFWYS